MHRISLLVTICAALVCGFTVMASASRVLVNVDLHTRNTPVTLTVQDADVNDVLSVLFNATDQYQLQTGLGIAGKIDTLQLTQTPFDDAVKAILAKANAKFTFSKEEGGIYRITNPDIADVLGPVPTLYKPDVKDNPMVTIKVTLPILVDKTKAKDKAAAGDKSKPAAPATDTPAPDSLLSDSGDTSKPKEADKPTTEECYLAMIRINNQPVHVFAVGFGADELPDFSTLANPNGTSGTSGSSYNGISSPYGTNSPYGSNYGTTGYGMNSPYGTTGSYPYGSTGSYPYGSTGSPYGTTTGYPYGTTTGYPYGTTTTPVTTTTTSKVVG